MKTKYAFAENINGTENTGIIEIYGMKLICLCDKEQSKIILPALSSSLQNRRLVEENQRLKMAIEKAMKIVDLWGPQKSGVYTDDINDEQLALYYMHKEFIDVLSYKEEQRNG